MGITFLGGCMLVTNKVQVYGTIRTRYGRVARRWRLWLPLPTPYEHRSTVVGEQGRFPNMTHAILHYTCQWKMSWIITCMLSLFQCIALCDQSLGFDSMASGYPIASFPLCLYVDGLCLFLVVFVSLFIFLVSRFFSVLSFFGVWYCLVDFIT